MLVANFGRGIISLGNVKAMFFFYDTRESVRNTQYEMLMRQKYVY